MREGDILSLPLPDGAFGAARITGEDRYWVYALALRWHSAQPPADLATDLSTDLETAGPLTDDAWLGAPVHYGVAKSDALPPGFRVLGNRPVPEGLPATSTTHSTWSGLVLAVSMQRRWDALPAAVRAAYRAGATRGPVEVDFGAGPETMLAATAGLDLTTRVPAAGPVRWAALDALPRCAWLLWSGPDRGLTAALAARPGIAGLRWTDAPAVADLSGTGLLNLDVAGPDLRELRLPRSAQHLTWTSPDPAVTVRAADDGRWLTLVLTAPPGGQPAAPPAGLRRVRDLVVAGGGTVSAVALGGLAELEQLVLGWDRGPGRLTDAAALAGAARLEVLELNDAYALDADTLPDLPALRHLTVHGLRRSVVAGLKTRYRGVTLVLGGAKDDTWLVANLDNPFRDWVDDDKRAGAAAAKAYATALRAVDRGEDPEPALRTLVAALNTVDARYDIIDTFRREQAGDAFLALAARAGVAAQTADTWFDDWRTF